MTTNKSTKTNYRVSEWDDVEHCVYHALLDAPENGTPHRIAHFVSRLAATMVEKGMLSVGELETFLHSCRG
jgi:hypothetical protein